MVKNINRIKIFFRGEKKFRINVKKIFFQLTKNLRNGNNRYKSKKKFRKKIIMKVQKKVRKSNEKIQKIWQSVDLRLEKILIKNQKC